LKRALIPCTDHAIRIGQVCYLDYEKEFVPENNTFSPLLHKRRSFSHENEVRAIIETLGSGGVEQPPVAEHGINVPVSLEDLVERVFIAPTTPDWVFKAIEGMVSRYGFRQLVCRSALSAAPIF
jgi:hypothetical protein